MVVVGSFEDWSSVADSDTVSQFVFRSQTTMAMKKAILSRMTNYADHLLTCSWLKKKRRKKKKVEVEQSTVSHETPALIHTRFQDLLQ